MIILVKKRIVILTPPHTASRYLRNTLCTPEYDGFLCVGPWSINGKLDHHSMIIPREYVDWPRYLIVRNPFTRLIGLYHYYVACHCEDGCPNQLNWEQYTDLVVQDVSTLLTPFYRWTITRLIEPLDRIDGIIRFENLQQQFQDILGITIEDHTNNYDLMIYYYSPEIIRGVSAWATVDCMRFQYPYV